jgi:hypothetical protein
MTPMNASILHCTMKHILLVKLRQVRIVALCGGLR